MNQSVVRTIYSRDRLRRVEIFQRNDGSFGFKEDQFSDDPFERCPHWDHYAIRHSESFCPSEAIALREVIGRVDWLSEMISSGEPIDGLPRPTAEFPPPTEIDGADVLCFAAVGDWQRQIGRCRHYVNDELVLIVAGLAVCRYQDDTGCYYLFRCDPEWHRITDTCHETIEEAKSQAEFEYKGLAASWQYVGK
jgi:hypothetical protein